MFSIGNGESAGGSENWDGRIAEILTYETVLTGADLIKVQTYLAVKYGKTLSVGSMDYISASGSVIRDATTNAGYTNDITGVGREDAQALSQLTSRSVNSDSLVTMAAS